MSSIIEKLVSKYDENNFYSMIRYPSILTYHNLGERGRLAEGLVEDKSFAGTTAYISEKIDGASSLICFSTDCVGMIDDYVIGSRTEALYYNKDRAINNSQGIVKNLLPYAEKLKLFVNMKLCSEGEHYLKPNFLYVFLGEHYGLDVNGAKQYTGAGKNMGWRVFDIINLTEENADKILEMPIEKIASWREHGGQPYMSVSKLTELCDELNIKTVPYIKAVDGDSIPVSIPDTYKWLQEFSKSNALLDDAGLGNAEGVVVRTANRSLIRKIRFEDYEKTKRAGLFK